MVGFVWVEIVKEFTESTLVMDGGDKVVNAVAWDDVCVVPKVSVSTPVRFLENIVTIFPLIFDSLWTNIFI